MTETELKVVYARTQLWTGPNTWGWHENYRLNLQETLSCPEYG